MLWFCFERVWIFRFFCELVCPQGLHFYKKNKKNGWWLTHSFVVFQYFNKLHVQTGEQMKIQTWQMHPHMIKTKWLTPITLSNSYNCMFFVSYLLMVSTGAMQIVLVIFVQVSATTWGQIKEINLICDALNIKNIYFFKNFISFIPLNVQETLITTILNYWKVN